MADLEGFLLDRRHMVRQAAIHALLASGPEGISKLYEHFLATSDDALRYQIVEELERSGVALKLLQNFGSTPSVEMRVMERLLATRASRQPGPDGDPASHLLRMMFENPGKQGESNFEQSSGRAKSPEPNRSPAKSGPAHEKVTV